MRLCQAVGRLLTTGAAVRSQTASTAPTTEELIKQLVDVTQTRFRYEVARDQAIMSGLLVYVEQRRRQTEGDFAVELPYEFRKEASRAQRAAMARVQYDNNLLLHVRVVAPNDQDDLVQRSLLRDVSAEMSAYARLLRLRGYSQTKIDHALETMYDDDDERLVDEDSLQQLKIEEILAGRRRCYSSASSSDSSMGSF
ncbi:unnamed protein product (mitochondrion) [Plasmodiophora brassicae]|uniref:Uncharacterized protein n=1 Tax=Plasmodiophora brassicae TaxID=37360 RepID=A0A3P3Y269_PLABS|nr:unnamed protein product [Plasmodiophora brassicae]